MSSGGRVGRCDLCGRAEGDSAATAGIGLERIRIRDLRAAEFGERLLRFEPHLGAAIERTAGGAAVLVARQRLETVLLAAKGADPSVTEPGIECKRDRFCFNGWSGFFQLNF